ncbi:MAG: family 43 glycosylhydrolase, partial [Gammaproteobacteria bacterium]|nr:family 43 glycosylhydrolase [Gammaproteobacteria bacterium]
MHIKHPLLGLSISCAIFLSGCSTTNEDYHFKKEGDLLVRHVFTADPSARVFNDRLYVYTSHDRTDTDKTKHFDMVDWHVFSTDNMIDWVDHGAFFGLDDISWAEQQAWAPDAIQRNGKYYFYYPVEQAMIGVAVSDSPTTDFVDPLDKPLIDKTGNEEIIGVEPIDPAILIDDDGQAYMYFGCREPKVVKLEESMIELAGPVEPVTIEGIEGDTTDNGGWYGEGPWVFKRNSRYYYMYSNGWADTATLVYAVADKPEGPFTFVGEVMTPNK